MLPIRSINPSQPKAVPKRSRGTQLKEPQWHAAVQQPEDESDLARNRVVCKGWARLVFAELVPG